MRIHAQFARVESLEKEVRALLEGNERLKRPKPNLIGEAMTDVWVSDCSSAQMNAPAKNFQLCIQHQLRDLKRILDRAPGLAWTS